MTTQIQTTIETNSNLLFRASIHGDAEEVKRLITVVDEQTKDSALGYAAKYGHIECIKLLIPVSNAKANNSFALRAAAENGHLQCVKLLIPVSDPKACDSFALAVAVAEGHIECVKLLLPVSDPKANNSCALRWAAESGHTEIVKLLIPVSECNSVIEQMQIIKHQYIDVLKQYIDEHDVLQQKDRLNNSLTETVDVKTNSVKRKM